MVGNSVFFDTFIGEYVEIVLKLKNKTIVSSPEETVERIGYVSFNGFLLDIDDVYYYIGETTTQIYRAVAIKDVVSISIDSIEPESVLNDIDVPEDPKEIH